MTRVRLFVLIAIGTTIGLLIGLFAPQPAKPAPEPPATPTKWDAHLFELDRKAIEDAYVEHVRQLFEVWMKDAQGQPERAVQGARRARKAYIGAMAAVEKREAEFAPH